MFDIFARNSIFLMPCTGCHLTDSIKLKEKTNKVYSATSGWQSTCSRLSASMGNTCYRNLWSRSNKTLPSHKHRIHRVEMNEKQFWYIRSAKGWVKTNSMGSAKQGRCFLRNGPRAGYSHAVCCCLSKQNGHMLGQFRPGHHVARRPQQTC